MKPILAHAFGQNYILPLPLWLFMFAAATVVVLSFVVFTFLIDTNTESEEPRKNWHKISPFLLAAKAITVLLLLVTIMADWTNGGALGLSVTLFWIILLLGLTYITAFFGNIWEVINPFKAILEAIEILIHRPLKPLLIYPAKLSYYPALTTYYGIIWLELLSLGFGIQPFNLSRLLLVYTLTTLVFAYYFGKEAWFKYGEFFSVFFRLVSKASPIVIQERKVTFVKPFSQLVDTEIKSFSLLIFIAFMLSSTGFDGFRETKAFQNLSQNLPDFLTNHFQLYQSIFLALSPFILLSAYFFILWLVKKTVSTPLSTMDLAKKFAYSLIPIAITYNAAHYFSLLYLEVPTFINQLLDPFELGWSNLNLDLSPISASKIWYTQIFLIVAGHVIAVYVAHKIALKTFKNRGEAIKSQYLMLLLMVLYTIGSLWIISQPLTVK